MKLKKEYFLQEDVVGLAKHLLGKTLVTKVNGIVTAGLITETETYNGIYDKASHAYGGKRTGRTEVMYYEGGTSYVYLCYGIHNLFNIVTGKKEVPHAILIRAIQPITGIETILQRRHSNTYKRELFVGPGKVTKALGIDLSHNAISLTGKTIWLEDDHVMVNEKTISVGPRIGVDYAGEDAKLPYRFWVNEI